VTSHLISGQPGVIKVFVQSDYQIRGYWEERQGYTIGGRSSVSYLIPATGKLLLSIKTGLLENLKFEIGSMQIQKLLDKISTALSE
jgi:hypothetical protein